MEIVLARIDNRLLHGIVMTQWAGTTGADRVMVIDDDVANNLDLKQAMNLAKPAGMSSSIITLETALTNIKTGRYENQKIFLLAKSPITILKLVEEGIKIPNLQIGATAELEGFRCSKRAFLNELEVEAVKKIMASGSSVTVQHVPTDTKIEFKSLIK
ncbi:MAG: PTS sugar transporter subunit IIB [Erysipelotrichaceae bacterium]|nr:PTS sugar transporter subunit IIB [Erysipelotrichaceae bacterium]